MIGRPRSIWFLGRIWFGNDGCGNRFVFIEGADRLREPTARTNAYEHHASRPAIHWRLGCRTGNVERRRDGLPCAQRSDTAPPLGAKLSADTGISGECLRTGKVQNCADTENDPLVDVEVCRSLGLRSIAVLPIQGWRGINGILEVFSTDPAAFTERDISVLEQLGALAERARASQPHGASSAAPKLSSEIKPSQTGGPVARIGPGWGRSSGIHGPAKAAIRHGHSHPDRGRTGWLCDLAWLAWPVGERR